MQKRNRIEKRHKIVCVVCGRETRRTSTYQKYCPKCRKGQYKQRQKDYEKRKGSHSIKLQQRANWLRRYAISPEQYNQMFDEQKGFCAICGRHQSELNATLCVDHCHETGKVRGLLCNGCNLLLGHFENNKTKIMEYLNDR